MPPFSSGNSSLHPVGFPALLGALVPCRGLCCPMCSHHGAMAVPSRAAKQTSQGISPVLHPKKAHTAHVPMGWFWDVVNPETELSPGTAPKAGVGPWGKEIYLIKKPKQNTKGAIKPTKTSLVFIWKELFVAHLSSDQFLKVQTLCGTGWGFLPCQKERAVSLKNKLCPGARLCREAAGHVGDILPGAMGSPCHRARRGLGTEPSMGQVLRPPTPHSQPSSC